MDAQGDVLSKEDRGDMGAIYISVEWKLGIA